MISMPRSLQYFLRDLPLPEKLELNELLIQHILGVRFSCLRSSQSRQRSRFASLKRGKFRKSIQPGIHFERRIPEIRAGAAARSC